MSSEPKKAGSVQPSLAERQITFMQTVGADMRKAQQRLAHVEVAVTQHIPLIKVKVTQAPQEVVTFVWNQQTYTCRVGTITYLPEAALSKLQRLSEPKLVDQGMGVTQWMKGITFEVVT